MEKKIKDIYLPYYNLLIAQDIWQAHHQILQITFLKEDILKTKGKYGDNHKQYETCGIKYKCCKCFPESINFRGILIEYKVYVASKIIFKNLMKKIKGLTF